MQITSKDGLTDNVKIIDKSGNDLVKNLDILGLSVNFELHDMVVATMQVRVHKLDLQNIVLKEVKHEI